MVIGWRNSPWDLIANPIADVGFGTFGGGACADEFADFSHIG